MGVIDTIIIICFVPALYTGLKNGFVKQVTGFCAIFFGIKLSLEFSGQMMEWISTKFTIPGSRGNAIAFFLIFFAVFFIFNIIRKILNKIIRFSLLKWLDRLLGILVSLCIFTVIGCVAVHLIDSANSLLHIIPQDSIDDSRFYPALLNAANELFPRIKEIF